MDQIDYPNRDVWLARQRWFDHVFDIERRGGAYVVGEHSTGLLVELQSVFCAGAFISVVLLACAVIDAHVREVEADADFDGGMQAAFDLMGEVHDLDWLRKRRNELVHFKSKRPLAISVDLQWSDRDLHELDARRAIEVVAGVMFARPFV